jgi:uncharacterized protein (TIGR03118 family)
MIHRLHRPLLAGAVALVAIGTVAVPGTAGAHSQAKKPNQFVQTDLVASAPTFGASLVDPNVTNAWGLAAGPSTPLWVSDNDSGNASVYTGGVAGSAVALALTVPVPDGSPTGQVFNSSLLLPAGQQAFAVGGSTGSPADFIVATAPAGASGPTAEIEAWNGQGSFVVEDSPSGGAGGMTPPGSLYTGLAISTTATAGPELYAADATTGQIDIFDSTFAPVANTGQFTDPGLPAGYTPYNVQELKGKVYVAYAALNRHHTNITGGVGKGVVDVFSVDGALIKHLVSNGPMSPLNEPWGLALAPKGFGPFAGKLLVGNLGNGKINAFNPSTGAFLGTLDNAKGKPIVIPGLWGLQVGNSAFGGANSLEFSAGPQGYGAGVVGILNPAP